MKRLVLLAGLIVLVLPVSALADCLEGLRNPSAGEMEYFKRVSAALKAILPAPPPNWKLAPTHDQDLGGLCNGDREGAFEIRTSASYSYTPPKEEADRLYAEYRKLQAEIDALKTLPPELAKERQSWLDKMSVGNRASNAASKAGDKALAKQKDSEAEDASKKAREIRDRYLAGVRANVEQLEAKQKALEYRGSSVTVSLVANEQNRSRAAAPLVVGNATTPATPGLKVHNVRVYLEGSAEKRGVIQAAIDRAALARIAQ